MSRRLSSAKNFILKKEKEDYELNASLIRQSISNFIRSSIRKQKGAEVLNESQNLLMQSVRASISRTLKSSIHQKLSLLGRPEKVDPKELLKRESLLQEQLQSTQSKLTRPGEDPEEAFKAQFNSFT